jgi:hypothetical protein
MTVTKYDCVIVSADGVATPVLPAEDAGAASTLDAGNGDTQGVKSNAGFARNTVSLDARNGGSGSTTGSSSASDASLSV